MTITKKELRKKLEETLMYYSIRGKRDNSKEGNSVRDCLDLQSAINSIVNFFDDSNINICKKHDVSETNY